MHDPLTGLANRSLFTQVVASRLESRDPSGIVPIVLFVDLDDFKLVNDSLGHAAGDALLVAVGERLRLGPRARATWPPAWAATSSRSCCATRRT